MISGGLGRIVRIVCMAIIERNSANDSRSLNGADRGDNPMVKLRCWLVVFCWYLAAVWGWPQAREQLLAQFDDSRGPDRWY